MPYKEYESAKSQSASFLEHASIPTDAPGVRNHSIGRLTPQPQQTGGLEESLLCLEEACNTTGLIIEELNKRLSPILRQQQHNQCKEEEGEVENCLNYSSIVMRVRHLRSCIVDHNKYIREILVHLDC